MKQPFKIGANRVQAWLLIQSEFHLLVSTDTSLHQLYW